MDAQTDRVVSLAPSATETLRALDATGCLVGVTHHCEVDDLAGATDQRSVGAAGRASAGTTERDATSRRPTAVGGWLNPDYDAVADCDPDLVLTAGDLQAEIADDLRDRGHDVVHVAPTTLEEVLDSFADVGAAVGLPDDGRALARRARNRLDRVARLVGDAADATGETPPGSLDDRDRPVVYCEEWSDPPMAAGNWVPEAVAAAGGRYPFLDPGERSREVSIAEVEAAAPDHVVLHVCGHGECADPQAVRERDWHLPAIERGNVHVVDDSLLNQPSPKLVEGVETLASLLHPEAVDS